MVVCLAVGASTVARNLNGQLHEVINELVRRGITLEQAKKEFEKQFIVSTLRSNEGNFSRSARRLGVHRNTLRNKVCSLEISDGDYSRRSKADRKRR